MPDNAQAGFGSGQVSNSVNQAKFLIAAILAKARHSAVVEVMDVTNTGGVSPIGYVTVRPMVQQVDGDGVTIDHGDIHQVPYMRVQGGSNAVILDPQVGDIGIAMFCDRDISVVKATGKPGAPGSRRRNHMADAVYLYSIIAGAPTQYVQFAADGIHVVSPAKVIVQAPEIDLNGAVAITGATLTHNGVNIGSSHEHSGVTRGSGVSDPPIAS